MLAEYWDFWWGGLAIATVSVVVVVVGGHFLSVTRGYVSLCAIVSRKSYFQRPEIGGAFGFRTMFSVGIILGGLLAALTTAGFNPSFGLGSFDTLWGPSLSVKAAVLLVGGFLWGYGSRMAKGCTSGNSISGLSKGSAAALVATVMFLVGGVIVAHGLQLILGGR